MLRQRQIFSITFSLKTFTPLKNDRKPPINQIFLTESRLYFLDFNEDEILKIIRDLNIRKAHIHDDYSIRVIKICDKSLLQPLIFIIQLNHPVVLTYGKDLISYLFIKRATNS